MDRIELHPFVTSAKKSIVLKLYFSIAFLKLFLSFALLLWQTFCSLASLNCIFFRLYSTMQKIEIDIHTNTCMYGLYFCICRLYKILQQQQQQNVKMHGMNYGMV